MAAAFDDSRGKAWETLVSRTAFRKAVLTVHDQDDLRAFLAGIGAASPGDLETIHNHAAEFVALLETAWANQSAVQAPARTTRRRLKGPKKVSGRRLKGGGGLSAGGNNTWGNPVFGSFDDFGQSMLLLLVLSSGDNWDTVMYHAMDGPAEMGLPRERNDASAA